MRSRPLGCVVRVEPIRRHRGDTPLPSSTAGDPEPSNGETAVYPAREDTRLLLPFAEVPRGTRLIEVGTGNGLAALTAARCGARVVATDLNPHALRSLRRRARAEGADLELVRTDLARGLGRFDRLLANPPYLPTRPEERDLDRWHNLALDGGPDGCRVTARLVAELDQHLTPGGAAFLVVSTVQDAAALARIWRDWTNRGGTAEVADFRPLEGEKLEVWRLGLGPG
ncbi:MAG: HemK2/MTQ2 family protein methyltransferase [Thermoplasmata archaeon]|jgi:release factor glutamine methyltransferase